MRNLSTMKCEPCSGEAKPLHGEALKQLSEQVPKWQVVNEHHLTREFKFDDFDETLEFVNRVGDVAEEQGHHPIITFTYGKATVELFTHKIDGLHGNDFILAAKIDEVAQEF